MHIIRRPIVGRTMVGFSKPDLDFRRSRSTDPDVYVGNREPSLADLIGDPLTRSLMASDGVEPETLASLLEAIRASLLGGLAAPAGQIS
ncbi:MAG: hypothetical protein HZC25_07805 [Rhodospirillales bacterium]|nr:hypothetical protein [Rhodospirillales bacterium]